MAGKRQKASSELQGYGSAHRGETPLTLVPPDARREVPAPPAELPADLHPVWHAFWDDRVSQLVKPADHYDVRRYFLLLAERERHERAIRRQPLVEGSMGQKVINPRLTLVKELTREIEKTREHLGILPLSRIRLNIAENAETVSGIAALRAGLNQRQSEEPSRGGGAVEAEVRRVVNLDDLT